MWSTGAGSAYSVSLISVIDTNTARSTRHQKTYQHVEAVSAGKVLARACLHLTASARGRDGPEGSALKARGHAAGTGQRSYGSGRANHRLFVVTRQPVS